MSPRDIVKDNNPLSLVALGLSILVCLVTVLSYLNSPAKELDVRIRTVEIKVSSIAQDTEWIKQSQQRVEERVLRKLAGETTWNPPTIRSN